MNNSTANKTPTVDTATVDTPSSAALPADYIKGGFLDTAPNGKHFLKAAYVGEYAEQIAAALTNEAPALSAAAFNSAFLRDTKKHLRRGVSFDAQATCAAAMVPQSIKLVAKRKAPLILNDIITKATGAVYDRPTFEALYKHLDAVYCYMLQNEQQKGGDT